MIDPASNDPLIRSPGDDSIEAAARHLRAGRLVAFPTETVYGLGGDATSDRAVAAVFAAKKRPSFNPLIVHVGSAAMAREIVSFEARAERLAAACWPGALTIVLPRAPQCSVSLLASAGLGSLAVRQPDHPVARRLIAATGRPLVGPSANPSGRLSPTRPGHVVAGLQGRVAMVLDGGPCRIGIESTVVDLTGDSAVVLRPGAITATMLSTVLGETVAENGDGAIRSPGMLQCHYAPSLPLRLEATTVRAGEALLAFGSRLPGGAATVANLSPSGDAVEAAANLFAMLHLLDRPDFAGIAVMPIPDSGLGRAINDRLRRAAAPRSPPDRD